MNCQNCFIAPCISPSFCQHIVNTIRHCSAVMPVWCILYPDQSHSSKLSETFTYLNGCRHGLFEQSHDAHSLERSTELHCCPSILTSATPTQSCKLNHKFRLTNDVQTTFLCLKHRKGSKPMDVTSITLLLSGDGQDNKKLT
jgi:hypothetical protein